MRADKASDRILLVCFRFGPGSDTGGYRWNMMVEDLVDRGWRFDVITAGNLVAEGGTGTLPKTLYDGAVRLNRVPPEWWGQHLREQLARLRATPAANTAPASVPPYGRRTLLDRFSGRLRRDAVGSSELLRDLDWTRRGLKIAQALAETHDYRCVIVSSPRHLTHLIGAELARRAGVVYVPDFRDPWYYGRGDDKTRLDPLTRRVWQRAERYCMRHARFAIDISEGAQRAVRADLPANLAAITRYFIPSGYRRLASVKKPDVTRFRVVYTGTVYPFNPLAELLAACGRFRRRHGLGADTLCVEFIGRLDERKASAAARAADVDDCFFHRPRRPADEATALQQSAAVLVAFDSVTTHAVCIPSKLYHYAQMKGRLLLIGDPSGAMAREAAKIGCATHSPDDAARLDATLDEAYARWRDGDLTRRNDDAGVFDAKTQSARMHALLDEIDDGGKSPGAPC